ncbi:DNA polymerase III subunit alpha [Candidatus Saccharibacteria bacterium]|nr:DNA polymerase III subunit alpha [Candidatus Saccharibacteria bacterium]
MDSKLSSGDFVHLHNHSQYSLLDGLTKLPELVDFVKNQGMEAVAVTDHGTLSGIIEFYKQANYAEIKPIIGIETYMAARKLTDKDPSKDKQRYHLILLAMNNKGYQNLMRLSTIANTDGYYYYPRIDRETLKKYSEGIIVLSACMGSEIGDALKQDQYNKAIDVAKWYKNVFGDRYYLEVQDHGHKDNPLYSAEQGKINKQILKIGKELDIPAVVTSDAHYLKHEDQEAHEVLLCVGTGSFLSDEKRMSLKDFPLHVTEPQEIINRWSTEPEVILNTKKIADRCNVSIELGKILIPKFEVPKGYSEKTYLEEMVYKGLSERYLNKKSETTNIKDLKKALPHNVLERAKYELSVIDSMGFNGYFLIIADFVTWGKSQGIVFGPGRGSAAGSIIAYSLRITELDPIRYDLLFERFLNPDRISMPDIDIDIQDTRRDEVIQYCVDKYGEDRVANIVTFGRMAARNAVRDTARVLQVPYAEADKLAKMIPPPVQGRHIPLEVSLKENNDLKSEYETNETAKRVFDLAVQLEGTIRSHGVHAAGVVIAPNDIVTYVPLEKAQKGVIATQYSMGPVEELGLLKMDFLGLSNLTIINNSLRIIKKVYKKNIDIDNLPLDDKKTFKLLQRGDTTGVFQLESAGMKRYLKALKPTEFDDIIAMGALYRPGPLTAGLTDKFIARKNGKEEVTYDHELMKPALQDTYGVMVYQEQFMQIVRDMCGFSGGESDTLRKAVGKKKRDMMATMKQQVIDGAVENNVDKRIAEKFWKDLEGFADYAFNKSHAACYALIAYQTAYLKAHYPDAFMAALMTSDYDNTDRLAIEISECQHIDVEVLPPDVNESFPEFAIVPGKNQIRFGLSAIKNVGTSAAEAIVETRKKVGHFKTIEDFFKSVDTHSVNKKTVESLIRSGGFDNLGDRNVLINNVDTLVGYANKVQKEAITGQTGLFGEQSEYSTPTMTLSEDGEKVGDNIFLQWERELLGIYLSKHPLDDYKDLLEENADNIDSVAGLKDGASIKVGGFINSVKEITTKKGDQMAFVSLSNGLGEIEVIVFPSVYSLNLGSWEKDAVVIVDGRVSIDANDTDAESPKIIAKDAKVISYDQAKAYRATGKKYKSRARKVTTSKKPTPKKEGPKKLYLRIHDSSNAELLLSIKDILSKHPGEETAVLVLGDDKSKQVVRVPATIKISDDLTASILKVLEEPNVAIK